MKFLDKINLQPKSLLLIFLAIATLVISSALFELYQSKKEMYDLMAEQSHSLLESTLAASSNALLAYTTIDKELNRRLLNNANMIKLLYDKGQITNSLLSKLADENNIYRINIFSNEGKKLFSNHVQVHFDLEETDSPLELLKPIFSGEQDTLILGIKPARFEDDFRFAVALASKNNSAIVLNINAEELLKFRKKIGFGSLLQKITQSNKIYYAALQDFDNIIAASGDVSNLENLEDSDFLMSALNDSTFAWRTIETDSSEIFEAVHPFTHNNRVVGLFRLGLSLEPLNAINERIVRRIIVIGIILFILGSLILTYIFTRQNFDLLKKEFKVVEGYSNKVIQNVSDAVIVLNANNEIKIFNSAAATLVGTGNNFAVGKSLLEIFNPTECKYLLDMEFGLNQMECTINNHKKYLLVSKSTFVSEDDLTNTIFVIRDLTNQKLAEEQFQRKERMVAMGELASGVAHEIRNPLNTISTITQQLSKDFEPKANKEEYYTLSNLVSKEIKRINETVNSFLRFSRPEKIERKEFVLSELLNQIETQYGSMLKEKTIEFKKEIIWDGKVNWDKNQMLQVLLNLIQNSFDSIDKDGEILLKAELENDKNVKLIIKDTGCGIPEHLQNKIFNLYFTTKAKGTGIGLSMVQRIVMEHGGTISADSEENKGTTIIITIPKT